MLEKGEQCNSRAGALYLYFLPVSAPMQYFVGRSRAGAGKEQGRSRVGAEQEQSRSKTRAGAGAQLQPQYKTSSMFGVKHKVERFHH